MMKHLKLIVLLSGLLLYCADDACALKGQLGDPVDGDRHRHNFSVNADAGGGPRALNNGTNDSTQICIFCHTPHGATAASTLWNRPDPIGPNGDGTFPVYGNKSGETRLVTVAAIRDLAQYGPSYGVYPNGASRLCLSCHDGVTAIGGVLNTGDSPDPSSGIEMTPGQENISALGGGFASRVIDLSVSHPISFIYNSTVITEITNSKSPIGIFDYNSAVMTPLDGQNRMQCTTCHDPHTDTRLQGEVSSYGNPMWRYTGGGDENADYNAVCANCHKGIDLWGDPVHDM